MISLILIHQMSAAFESHAGAKFEVIDFQFLVNS
jgi:hypothetical protein